MAGEKDLEKLLRFMSPKLIEGEYVFCTIKDAGYGDFSETCPIASFVEPEGLSLVLLKSNAEKFELSYEGIFRCISLEIHSSLDAVGLTAAVSGTLASHGIAANVIAGYFHDHIFVPSEFAKHAIALLSLSSNQKTQNT